MNDDKSLSVIIILIFILINVSHDFVNLPEFINHSHSKDRRTSPKNLPKPASVVQSSENLKLDKIQS